MSKIQPINIRNGHDKEFSEFFYAVILIAMPNKYIRESHKLYKTELW